MGNTCKPCNDLVFGRELTEEDLSSRYYKFYQAVAVPIVNLSI